MLNYPLGPVDLGQPHTRLTVAKQPCDLPWVRRVTLPIGEHAVQGDIRMYLADPYGRRLQAAGVLTASYVSCTAPVVTKPLPEPHFDAATSTGTIVVDGARVDVIDGRMQVPGQRADNVGPYDAPVEHQVTVLPHDAQPIAPVFQVELPAPVASVVQPIATEIPAAATENEVLATEAPVIASIDLPVETTPSVIENATTWSIDQPVVAENAVVTNVQAVHESAPAPAPAVRRRQVPGSA